MINKVKILLLIMTIGISAGCEDWLEQKPLDDLVQDEYWQTKEDVEAILMGAYVKFSSMDSYLLMFGELRGDMIEPENPTTNQRNIMEGNIVPNNSYTNWDDFYEVINYCNYVLEFSDLVKERDPTFTPFQLAGYKSEAIFLRSLSYFYLTRIFKDVPLVLNSSKSDDQNFFVAKSADTTILRVITEDLIKARVYSQSNFASLIDNRGRATKSAFDALLADISLWQFKYEECVAYCNNIDIGAYPLVHGSQWFSIFYPGNSLESILEFQFDQGLGQSNNLYDITYEDERFKASTYAQELLGVNEPQRKNGSFRATDFFIWKYAGATSTSFTLRSSSVLRDANWIVYRMADILLMKAEALNQLDRGDEAMALVNQIRTRAMISSVSKPSTINGIEDIILEERARELAFEGKRYFDLLRMGRRNDYSRKAAFIERIIQNVNPSQRFVLSTKLVDPNGWYFPIYINELEANINLKQNPYYESLTNF